MAEFTERPKVRESKAEVEIEAGKKETRRGACLDDVLRVILWDQRATAGWSTLELARRLGLPRTTLQGFFDLDRYEARAGTSLDVLSTICAAEKIHPDALFQLYDDYRPENRHGVRFAEDAVFDRFRALLTVDQAKAALALLDAVKRLGILDGYLETESARVGAARPARSKALKRRRT